MDLRIKCDSLKEIIESFLKQESIDLVNLSLRYEGGNLVLRILADKPGGGITMDECALLNRNLRRLLDEKDIIKDKYILEVSSPGLDRPLKCGNDFMRFLNKRARFFLKTRINGKLEWEGLINRVDTDKVYITVNEGIIAVPFLQINKAKLVI
ncbi:MAG: ribosome maturation factor RimP [Candidatus Omnitrophica bacterium]|nr:ribosome maturation factor RimP [Candidatus Omnitrophota bacterium]